MATILKRKQSDGTWRWTAQIRLARLAPVSQTFSDKKLAKEWADQREQELIGERERGVVRRDVGKLTVEDLHLEYLGDPATKALRTIEEHLASHSGIPPRLRSAKGIGPFGAAHQGVA